MLLDSSGTICGLLRKRAQDEMRRKNKIFKKLLISAFILISVFGNMSYFALAATPSPVNISAEVVVPPPPPPPGGGGGGGGWGGVPVTSVTFSGRAYPNSTITLLKDAQIAATTVAGADANFTIILSGLSGGNFIFSVYSEDNKGIRSSLLTFPISVTSGATTKVGGIFIAPTLTTDKSEVRRGDNITIFGQSKPNAEITIEVNSEEVFFNKVNADEDGVYLFNFDTSFLSMKQHSTRSKAAYKGEISSFSKSVSFLVGVRNVARTVGAVCGRADLNCDGRVNLVDFSITAFWHNRPLSAEFIVRERERLSDDGRVSLVDFSIIAFHWTG